MIQHVAIIGTGLIGASFGLALRQAGSAGMTRTAIRDLFGRHRSGDRIGAALGAALPLGLGASVASGLAATRAGFLCIAGGGMTSTARLRFLLGALLMVQILAAPASIAFGRLAHAMDRRKAVAIGAFGAHDELKAGRRRPIG
jgi:hypothetical protein